MAASWWQKTATLFMKNIRVFADLRKKDSITDSTALHIASTGKTFTAMAILRLVQENKLSLDDSLQTYFPLLPYQGITVKMLLNHQKWLAQLSLFPGS